MLPLFAIQIWRTKGTLGTWINLQWLGWLTSASYIYMLSNVLANRGLLLRQARFFPHVSFVLSSNRKWSWELCTLVPLQAFCRLQIPITPSSYPVSLGTHNSSIYTWSPLTSCAGLPVMRIRKNVFENKMAEQHGDLWQWLSSISRRNWSQSVWIWNSFVCIVPPTNVLIGSVDSPITKWPFTTRATLVHFESLIHLVMWPMIQRSGTRLPPPLSSPSSSFSTSASLSYTAWLGATPPHLCLSPISLYWTSQAET